jgi:hypothetical protein
LKKIAIDLKNDYAALVAGGDFILESFKIDFGQHDLTDSENRLFKMAGDHVKQLCDETDIISLAVPMRYSMIKLVDIDLSGIEKYGKEFLNWEASQQLPDELGNFSYGFHLLGKSFDGKKVKYLFWAAPQEFIDRLVDFIALPDNTKLKLNSEAMGLYMALDKITTSTGLTAAIFLEPDGASVVISHDGDFIGAKFIKDSGLGLKDELVYYIYGISSESLKPQVLICGNPDSQNHLGDLTWAERLDFEKLDLPQNPEIFVTAFGLNLID